MLLGVVALAAQLTGVSSTRYNHRTPSWKVLSTMPGASVPDLASTKLASSSTRARKGETIRMKATMTVRALKFPRSTPAQIVCGIRYSRKNDATWTLGSAYETVILKRRSKSERIPMERSFVVPATDHYRASATCHVQAPSRGSRVLAQGTMRIVHGLPKGAATPVR